LAGPRPRRRPPDRQVDGHRRHAGRQVPHRRQRHQQVLRHERSQLPEARLHEEELPVNPDTLTAQSLLNCLVREVSLPEQQTWESDGHLIVRLARLDRLLRLGTRRRSGGPSPRLTGEAELHCDDAWRPVAWAELARLIADELTLATGTPNEEFAAQARASRTAVTAILEA